MRTPTAVVLWLSFLFQSVAYACDDWAAMVVSVNGHVQLKHADVLKVDGVVSENKNLKPDDVVCPGQQLHVGANSRAAIYLRNNSFVRLDENTILSFPAAYTAESQGFWIEVTQGVSHFISRLTQRFEVRTTYTNAAVDGTEFLVAADANGSKISVIEGQVRVTPVQSGATQTLIDGQSATLVKGSPMQVMQLTATDTVDWAVYFPPLVLTDQLSSPKYNQQLSRASRHITAGRADLAIQLLTSIPAPDSAVQVSLASAYLSVGNLRLAKMVVTDIHTGEALALQSLIATLTNQPQQAVELAQSAVKANSQSLAALLALTYAYQGNLQLNAALEVAREAAQAYPQEYIVWVRLSELQVATGDISGADQSIDRAMALNNAAPVVLVQSGFIDLFNHHYKQAESLFRSAIKADSENPQARLGMGLVLLRQGELEAGRMQLEYAVSLDPARSVLRSYLGRAYFEEKRDDEASVQWALAKQFDPQDPTAYYYEGVRKLYSNDPVGAIEELETSRRLNDERALYRSETLLQGDAASRSAALARAYDEVGYDQGVLLAGWDAIRQDPTNSEGHRLLADKYRGNSRYDAARASELLQSQLWQPLSAYPLQPQLSETGIGFVEGAGPQQPGYNEYHSLFTQDGVYGAVNGYGGSDGTWGDDLVGSFLAGPVAVSLGQYHFESDGWRDNADQEQDVYSGFVQWEVSPSTSLQLEARSLTWVHGSLLPNIYDLELRSELYDEDRQTYRFGMVHSLDSGLDLVLSLITHEQVVYKSLSDDLTLNEAEVSDESDSAEFQFVWLWDNVQSVLGGGVGKIDSMTEAEFGSDIQGMDLLPDQYDLYIAQSSEEVYKYANTYAYFNVKATSALSVVLGFSYDRIDADYLSAVENSIAVFIPFPPPGGFVAVASNDKAEDRDAFSEVSPKVGFEYQLAPGSSLRLAYFKSLSRPVAANQTIEPTQFVGFNQFYDDPNFSTSKNISFGINQQISDAMYFDVSLAEREVDFTVWDADVNDYLEYKFDELILDASFHSRVGRSAAVSVGLEWNQRDNNEFGMGAANLSDSLDVLVVPVELVLVGKNGVLFGVNQSYYSHDVMGSTLMQGESRKSAWVTSVSLDIDLPKRLGALRFGVENILGVEEEISNYDGSKLNFYPDRFYYCSINLSI
ncbi:MAG: TonB-dependent receptor [Ketobacter sp.]|nr:TonB-dependent receptor [Ketobacter sp.]